MIKNIFERTKESVRDFTSDLINNLGFIIPILIGMITFISGVISYIRFIVAGGYVNQVNATKEFGLFSGYDEKFTSGTTGMITAGGVGKIILVLIGIEFVLMLINYFRTSGKAKRIVMIVDLVVMVIQIVLTTVVFWIAIGSLVVSEEAVYEALKPFGGISINPKAILITYAVVTLASLICFLVLVLITKDCRWMIGYSAISLAVAYIGLPLVFLFLQNIIPLATGAIALAYPKPDSGEFVYPCSTLSDGVMDYGKFVRSFLSLEKAQNAVLEWNECGGFGTVNKNNLIPYDVSEEDMENRKHRICMRRKVDE